MTGKTAKRRKSTIGERTTPCACCRYPISHRHHLFAVAPHGENRHTVQLCPNCHELFHLIQASLIRESEGCDRLLQAYLEAKGGTNDPAFRFLIAKVLEVEELHETFTGNTLEITEAVREELELYVPNLTHLDILGTFGIVNDQAPVQFKVGVRVSESSEEGTELESLWVFDFSDTQVTNIETLRVTRGADGLFNPAVASTWRRTGRWTEAGGPVGMTR